MLSKIFFGILILIIFVGNSITDRYSSLNSLFILNSILIFLFATVLYFFGKRPVKNWFRLDFLFLLGFFITHFQLPLMYILTDLVDEVNLAVRVNENLLNYGIWLTVFGGLFFILGLSINFPPKKQKSLDLIEGYNSIIWITWFFFIGFVLTAGKQYLTGSTYLGLGGKFYGAGISPYFQRFSSFINIILVVLVVLEYSKITGISFSNWLFQRKKAFLFLIMIIILLSLWVGDRGPAITLIMAFLIMISYFIRRITLKEFSIIFFVGAFIMTIVGVGRAINSNDNIFERGLKNFEFNSIYSVTTNLAGSSAVLLLAIDEVPGKHDYFYGKTMLGNILGIFPFAQSTYLEVTNDKQYELNSADYLTYAVLGENPHTGLGTTIIADIYINFGVYGVILLMFLYGMFINFLQTKLSSADDIFWIIVAAFVGSNIFYQSRSTLFLSIRDFSWILILFTLFKKTRSAI